MKQFIFSIVCYFHVIFLFRKMNDPIWTEVVNKHTIQKKLTSKDLLSVLNELKAAYKSNAEAMSRTSSDCDDFERGFLLLEKTNIANKHQSILEQYEKQVAKESLQESWTYFKSTRCVLDLAMCWTHLLQCLHHRMWFFTAWYIFIFASLASVYLVFTLCSNSALIYCLILLFVLGHLDVKGTKIMQLGMAFCSMIWIHVVFFHSMSLLTSMHGLFIVLHLIARAKHTPLSTQKTTTS